MTENEKPYLRNNEGNSTMKESLDSEEIINKSKDEFKSVGDFENPVTSRACEIVSTKDTEETLLSRSLNKIAREVTESTNNEIIPDVDPREKAMTYLEESGAIRIFQKLAAEIVHDRPENPLQYMIDALQPGKNENMDTS